MKADPPWENPAVLEAVAKELASTYAGTDYPVPYVGEVIEAALEVVAADTLDRAEDQATCNKVDECTAEAILFRALAGWLHVEVKGRRDRRAAMDELVRLGEEMGLYDGE